MPIVRPSPASGMDAAGLLSLDWSNRWFYSDDGSTIVADWSGMQNPSSPTASTWWDNAGKFSVIGPFTVYHTVYAGTPVLQVTDDGTICSVFLSNSFASDGIAIYISGGGQMSSADGTNAPINTLDWANMFLNSKDGAGSGVLSLHWADRKFYGTNGSTVKFDYAAGTPETIDAVSSGTLVLLTDVITATDNLRTVVNEIRDILISYKQGLAP